MVALFFNYTLLFELSVFLLIFIATMIRAVDPLLKCKCDSSTHGCEKGEDGRWFLPCGATGQVCGWRESTILSADGKKVTSALYRCEVDAENLNTKCLAKIDCTGDHGHHSNSCSPRYECRCETDFCEPSKNLDPQSLPGSSKCTPDQECECMKKLNKTCDSDSNIIDMSKTEPIMDTQTESFTVTTGHSNNLDLKLGENTSSSFSASLSRLSITCTIVVASINFYHVIFLYIYIE